MAVSMSVSVWNLISWRRQLWLPALRSSSKGRMLCGLLAQSCSTQIYYSNFKHMQVQVKRELGLGLGQGGKQSFIIVLKFQHPPPESHPSYWRRRRGNNKFLARKLIFPFYRKTLELHSENVCVCLFFPTARLAVCVHVRGSFSKAESG